jgi:hypothetical protein
MTLLTDRARAAASTRMGTTRARYALLITVLLTAAIHFLSLELGHCRLVGEYNRAILICGKAARV